MKRGDAGRVQAGLGQTMASPGEPRRALAREEVADQQRPPQSVHIERQFDAERLNNVLNHESVYQFVHGAPVGKMDLTAVAQDHANVVLMGEHGGMIFNPIQAGIWEAHTHVVPEGRGKWAVGMATECLKWMFCRTNALEIITRLPKGNIRAKALARRFGFRPMFVNPRGWIMDHQLVPAEIVSLTIQEWMTSAPSLVEAGEVFHRRLAEEFARHGKMEKPHPDDATHDRFAGLAFEMAAGGQPFKAQVFYHRFAAVADYLPFVVINESPLTIDIQSAILIIKPDGDFWCPVVR